MTLQDAARHALAAFSGDWQHRLFLGGATAIAAILLVVVAVLVWVAWEGRRAP